MAFRVSFFFTQQAELLAGWSENFWNNQSDLTGVIAAAGVLRDKLGALKGVQTVCPNVRISDASTFRKVKILRFAVSPLPTGVATDSDFPTTAGLLELSSSTGYVTRQWFKGVKDRDIRIGAQWAPTASSVTAFNAIAAELTSTGNGWVIKRQDRSVPKKTLVSITQAGVVTVTAHGYDNGVHERISRAKGTFSINKVWQIQVLDANTFQLIGFQTPAVPAFYLGNGTVQLQTSIFPAISLAEITRATERKVGRPFGLFIGRRRRRAI